MPAFWMNPQLFPENLRRHRVKIIPEKILMILFPRLRLLSTNTDLNINKQVPGLTKSAIVAKNFSRNPDFYHRNAEIQRYAADRLFNEIINTVSIKPSKILELGFGTGFLT